MFPNSLALTNYPKTLQQTFDIKCQPPQAITIETLHAPQKYQPIINNKQIKYQPLSSGFENKMSAMKLLARNRITSTSRQDDTSNASEGFTQIDYNPIPDIRKDKVGTLQRNVETKDKSETEIVRLKNILEEQLSQLESIIDPSKAKKSQTQRKKPIQQAEEKDLSLKINRVILSLSREVSSLERQINRLSNGKEDSNELGKKLLSTYQFSMSFIQSYHNEYNSKLTESSQNNFKEKLSKLNKSLANCVTQLSEFPNFDFPMPDLGPSTKQAPAAVKQKGKVSNPKKKIAPPKRFKNIQTKLPQKIDQNPSNQNRHYIRKPLNQYPDRPLDIHPNFSSDESLISLLAKPGHSRLASPSNSRLRQLDNTASRYTERYLNKHNTKHSLMTYLDFGPIINGLAQETMEEMIDEQISELISSINLSEVVSDLTPLQTFQSLPNLIEDLDYYLSAIDSYQNMVSSMEKNLECLQIRTQYEPKTDNPGSIIPPYEDRDIYQQEDTIIVIPKPEPTITQIESLEPGFTEQNHTIPSSINPLYIQNLTNDKYKMLRHNRLHQPSIRFAMKHNLLDNLKNEILNKSMDTVSEQIFQTLDNYVEKNFFDEFLKTPETMNLMQNIMRSDGTVPPAVETSTLGIQTEKLTKNVQIQSILSSPSLTNTPTSSQIYTTDFSTDKSNIESTPFSEDSDSLILKYKTSIVENPTDKTSVLENPTENDFTRSVASFIEDDTLYTNNFEECTEQAAELSQLQESVESFSIESPLKQSLLALTPIMDASSLLPVETEGEDLSSDSVYKPEPIKEPADSSISLGLTDSTISPVTMSDQSGSNNDSTDDNITMKSHLSPLTSKEPSLSDIAFESVLRKRSDIVCLDIDSMLVLNDVRDPSTYSPTPDSDDDQQSNGKHTHDIEDTAQKHTHTIQEYSTTFTQSNSTLYSLSEVRIDKTADILTLPQTPIFQDSLDNTNANTHSSPDTESNTATIPIEEDISVSLST
ncbi:hypothetical protein LOD99_243 [Oopsacas minuta]|uniref:Uncharacterized protein n=1 Tax=Oopsacas minuta TaxID=111878 RepID=A0AAV7K8E6_9METZ|nr:hypothetical protein LOD99_243 [Oopsacas minuta]